MALLYGDSNVFDPFSFFSGVVSEPSRQYARDASAVANTRVDWLETPGEHVFKVDLPGLSKEDVKIQMEDRTMQISGERKKEEVRDGDKWHRVERVHGSFMRKFRLPDNANVDGIKADFCNGVLTITIPKAPKPQPREILIQ